MKVILAAGVSFNKRLKLIGHELTPITTNSKQRTAFPEFPKYFYFDLTGRSVGRQQR
jgi:hypothetical protein